MNTETKQIYNEATNENWEYLGCRFISLIAHNNVVGQV